MMKEKLKKAQKQIKKQKLEISDKDMIINNQRGLAKEIKTMKEQWRVSEEIRNEQMKMIKGLQQQISQQAKDYHKLKKKYEKVKARGQSAMMI